MKRKIIVSALIILLITAIGSFLLGKSTIESIKDTFTIIGGLTSFVVMILAILLYDKFGIDKTLKEKNLDISLRLLEDIKKITIRVKGKDYMLQYRATIVPITFFEMHYGEKLLFPENYYQELNSLFVYSDNLYLPKDIKIKLDNVLPFVLGKFNKEIKEDEYGKVIINYHESNKWEYNMINKETDITLYDYLIKWDELISTIQDWCEKNSDSEIDLNVR